MDSLFIQTGIDTYHKYFWKIESNKFVSWFSLLLQSFILISIAYNIISNAFIIFHCFQIQCQFLHGIQMEMNVFEYYCLIGWFTNFLKGTGAKEIFRFWIRYGSLTYFSVCFAIHTILRIQIFVQNFFSSIILKCSSLTTLLYK